VATTTKYHDTQLELKATEEDIAKLSIALIVARKLVSENALFAEHVKEELYLTATDLMAVNEETAILKGMSLITEMQATLDDDASQKKSLRAKVGSLAKGARKWKGISKQLSVLKSYLIRHTATHIKKNAYTAESIARVMDLHHGFNVCGLGRL
jgi:hypothetical protein